MNTKNMTSPAEFEALPNESLKYFESRAVFAEQEARAPVVAALDYALETRNIVLLKRMLDAGMDPDTVRHQKRTALMFSVYREDIELTELMLSYGASPYVYDADDDSAVKMALRAGGEMSNLLCSHLFKNFMDYAEKNPIGINKDREFALDDHPSYDDDGEEEYLSGRKKNVKCLLVWLIEHEYEDLFHVALAKGYDAFGSLKSWAPPTYQPSDFWKSEDENLVFSDPIMDAIMAHSRIGFAIKLLRARNDRFLKDASMRRLAPRELALMVEKYHTDLEWLNENGAFPKLPPVHFPLMRDIEDALDDDDTTEIQELLDNGKTTFIYTSTGELLAEYAHNRKLKSAKIIVSKFINEAINTDDSLIVEIPFDGHTLLSLAAEYDLKEQCEILLDRGANPNGKSGNSLKSPILITANHRNKDIALLLIAAGANTDAILLQRNNSLWKWFNENVTPLPPIKPRIHPPHDHDLPF